MGYVLDEMAGPTQKVTGYIIGHKDDLKLKPALMVNPSIQFFRYEVSFKLVKGKAIRND